MPPKTEPKESPNGTAPEEVDVLTDDSKDNEWLKALLSHPQVCSLFVEAQDKAIASRIQAKLSRA